ncbi:hypothetical protein A3K73_05780 [Candidatus Pacearchaeota archaeon RBG_13_36_9]|nr:MAG: hypothetical protein A3K73_05780 [Candidatus Pacearchaeota archaeon RBG_13_36_9]
MKNKLDFERIFYYLAGLSFLILIIFIILWTTGFLPIFFKDNFTYFFFIIAAIITTYSALKIKSIPEHDRDKSSIVYLSKYFFLLTLIVIAINQFLKRAIITAWMPEITLVRI